MPDFSDFIDQIKAAGVTVHGEDVLRTKLEAVDNWTEEMVWCAQYGRKEGIRFTLASIGNPDDGQLAAIVSGYPFMGTDGAAFVNNVMPV